MITYRAPEPQIIEYQAQQNKLFPPIAATFAFHFASSHLWTLYNKTTKNKGQVDLQMLPDVIQFYQFNLFLIAISYCLYIAASWFILRIKSSDEHGGCQLCGNVAPILRRTWIYGLQQLSPHLCTLHCFRNV